MAKILFTIETGGDTEAVHKLITALGREFPAFNTVALAEADSVAAIVVSGSGDVPDEAWARLNGWGHGNLTLELV
jgi:hypothetical protein